MVETEAKVSRFYLLMALHQQVGLQKKVNMYFTKKHVYWKPLPALKAELFSLTWNAWSVDWKEKYFIHVSQHFIYNYFTVTSPSNLNLYFFHVLYLVSFNITPHWQYPFVDKFVGVWGSKVIQNRKLWSWERGTKKLHFTQKTFMVHSCATAHQSHFNFNTVSNVLFNKTFWGLLLLGTTSPGITWFLCPLSSLFPPRSWNKYEN